MKAVRVHSRGGPEQLVYEEAPLPDPAAGEVRVRVFAAGITPTELTWDATYQTPDGATAFPASRATTSPAWWSAWPGGDGGFSWRCRVRPDRLPTGRSAAEFVAVPAAHLAPKPGALDHVRAAAVPLSALTAWQALFDHAGLAAGQKLPDPGRRPAASGRSRSNSRAGGAPR